MPDQRDQWVDAGWKILWDTGQHGAHCPWASADQECPLPGGPASVETGIALQSIPCQDKPIAAAQPEHRMQTSFLLSEESQPWELGSVPQEPEGGTLPQSVQRHRGQSLGCWLIGKAGSALGLTCRSDVQQIEHRPGSQNPWALCPALSLTCRKSYFTSGFLVLTNSLLQGCPCIGSFGGRDSSVV